MVISMESGANFLGLLLVLVTKVIVSYSYVNIYMLVI